MFAWGLTPEKELDNEQYLRVVERVFRWEQDGTCTDLERNTGLYPTFESLAGMKEGYRPVIIK